MSPRFRRILLLAVVCYALLMACSFFVRRQKTRAAPLSGAPGDGAAARDASATDGVERRVQVPAIDGDRNAQGDVLIVYNEFGLRAGPRSNPAATANGGD